MLDTITSGTLCFRLLLVVYNMTGSVVREVSLNGGEGCMRVDVSSLPAGVYMYGIKSRANVYGIKKLVVK